MHKPSYFTRIKAFLIDYPIIIAYAIVIFLITYFVVGEKLEIQNPIVGQMIGFFSLTLPVVLYFIISEVGEKKATIGKQKMKLSIANKNLQSPFLSQIIIRNIVKFLPWEIAHTFIHQLFFYVRKGEELPSFVLVGLIIPQLIVTIYIITPLINKKGKSIYDMIAGTVVVKR